MAARKKTIHTTPKGWTDWNPVGSWLHGAEKKSKGAISAKNLQTLGKIEKAVKDAAVYNAVGDPKAGKVSMAINAGTWLVPYGKINKGIDAVVGGKKVVAAIKGAKQGSKGVKAVVKATGAGSKAIGQKTVRGIAKGAAITAVDMGSSAAARKARPRPKGRR